MKKIMVLSLVVISVFLVLLSGCSDEKAVAGQATYVEMQDCNADGDCTQFKDSCFENECSEVQKNYDEQEFKLNKDKAERSISRQMWSDFKRARKELTLCKDKCYDMALENTIYDVETPACVFVDADGEEFSSIGSGTGGYGTFAGVYTHSCQKSEIGIEVEYQKGLFGYKVITSDGMIGRYCEGDMLKSPVCGEPTTYFAENVKTNSGGPAECNVYSGDSVNYITVQTCGNGCNSDLGECNKD